MLELQPSTVIFQIVNFLVLLFVLSRFLYRPVLRTMRERQAAITARLNEAAEREAEAAAERQRLQQQTVTARLDAERMLAEARATAIAERDQLLEAARQQAARFQASAELDIQQQEERALCSTAARVRSTATSLAATLIRQAAGPAIHQALVDQLIGAGLPPAAALATELLVELAYPEDPNLRQRLAELTHAQLTVRENPDLVAGARILTSQQVVVELSVRRTLEELQAQTNGAVT